MAQPSSVTALARTAIAHARVAALTTYPRHARPATMQVRVRDDHGALVGVKHNSTLCRAAQARMAGVLFADRLSKIT